MPYAYDSVWNPWISSFQTSASTYTSTATISNTVWSNWNVTAASTTAGASVYTTSTSTDSIVWSSWVGTTTPITANFTVTLPRTWSQWTDSFQINRNQRVEIVESEQERLDRLAREEIARTELAARQERSRIESQKRHAQRLIAIQKADKLLDSVLNSVQKEQLSKHSWFLVKSMSGKVYRIRKGRSMNVDLLNDKGEVIQTLCAHPSLDVPDGDTVVSQKLMLEADEEQFLKIANKSSGRLDRISVDDMRRILENC